jgi:hypothetical protein
MVAATSGSHGSDDAVRDPSSAAARGDNRRGGIGGALGLDSICDEVMANKVSMMLLPVAFSLMERAILSSIVPLKEAGSAVFEEHSNVKCSVSAVSAKGHLPDSANNKKLAAAEDYSRSTLKLRAVAKQLGEGLSGSLLSIASLISFPWRWLQGSNQPAMPPSSANDEGLYHDYFRGSKGAFSLWASVSNDKKVVRMLRAISKCLRRLSEGEVGQPAEASAAVRYIVKR